MKRQRREWCWRCDGEGRITRTDDPNRVSMIWTEPCPECRTNPQAKEAEHVAER